jgi:hypothetical protein
MLSKLISSAKYSPYERGTQIPTLVMTGSYQPFAQERTRRPTPAAENNIDTQIPTIHVNSNNMSTLPRVLIKAA